MTLDADRQRAREALARAEKATKGPWSAEVLAPGFAQVPEPLVSSISGGDYLNEPNAIFIATARQDVPWLASRLLAALDVVEEAKRLAEVVHRRHIRPPRKKNYPALNTPALENCPDPICREARAALRAYEEAP